MVTSKKYERLGYAAAAERLGVTERTLRAARSAGELEGFKVGRKAEFTPEELDRWMESRRDSLSRRQRTR